jgi:UDP-N-acetyl-D-mannosaminuronic acid dehydrogenase
MNIKKIGVVGMGYVGIPAALLFADCPEYDFVYGFQRDSKKSGYKIDMLNNGIVPFKGEEPDLQKLLTKVHEKFMCTSDFKMISECDAVTISIQTPFENTKDLTPDFNPLIEGLIDIGKNISIDTLVVLESTVTPGTTIGLVKNILERESGLDAGVDFYLAHAPERVMVGRLLQNLREHDRIVGGIDRLSTHHAVELYRSILTTGKVIPMFATSAEVTKTAENTFRDLQIAAVNELALYCESLGINFYDVRNGIDSLKGEGITRAILYPGAGVGGHCLTKDTYHLERGVKYSPYPLDYPEGKESLYTLARDVNDFMPIHMVNLTLDAMKRINIDPSKSQVAILGWSFIADSDDARNTPSETAYNIFLSKGTTLRVHDPYVTKYPYITFSPDIASALHNSDAAIIFTGHSEYKNILDNAFKIKDIMRKEHPIIVDGRNIIDPQKFIYNGFVYKGIGRGDRNNHQIKE